MTKTTNNAQQLLISWGVTLIAMLAIGTINAQTMQKELTSEEKHVIIDKGTERPFSGRYNDFKERGTYTCKQCGALLYSSEDKFDSGCGWPSFDDEIQGAVKRTPDADGRRTEITCAKCEAHLGHVFTGEGLTDKDTRHCVNSISMSFTPATTSPEKAKTDQKTAEAIFAGGCFWGVEHLLQKQSGVISVVSGYVGGAVDNPTYEQICTEKTGHVEAVRVSYDPSKVSYETLAKLFFEIHDPTQADGQGPDIGAQYRSEIFYFNDQQKRVSEKLIDQLKDKGYDVVTKVTPATKFWTAEKYHQDYYDQKGTEPYCHSYTKRF